MTEEKIKAWCIDVWPKRWKELAPSSDSRALFIKETIKLKPKEEDLKKWEGDIVAQAKFWREKSRIEKVFGIPRLSQWMKDRRFDDEFIDESAMEMKARAESKLCHCGQPVLGEKYPVCVKHIETEEQKQRHRKNLTDLGLYSPGQSLSELSQKCREYLQQNGGSKRLLAQMTSSKPQPKPGNQ